MESFEPPKYIASLIASVNDGAKSAQLGALAFIAIGLFLLATAFSATDEDLLLNHAISISQLGGAQVPVVLSFGLAPAVFLAAHLYTLIRFDMLAGNLRQLREDLPAMVKLEADRERCRQLLANVEFVSALVTPKQSRASSRLFRWTVTFVIAVFPVAVLVLVQTSSLRLQHEVVSWVHHGCLCIDLVLLVWFFGRQKGNSTWNFWTTPLRRKLALCSLPTMIMVMDLAWLSVPGPESDTVQASILSYRWPLFRNTNHDEWLMVLVNLPRQPIDLLLCPYVGWGCRFLTVTYRPVVAKVWDAKTYVYLRSGADADDNHLAAIEGMSLRERTLRFANLTGSELFAVDLTGADLRHATLQYAVLKRAKLNHARLQGADLFDAELQGADLSSRSGSIVNFFEQGAQLQGANLMGANLQGADLFGAQLQGAVLPNANLQGTDLNEAQLQGASIFGARLQGATLRGAQLQGADLSRAQMQGADLDEADLQGADLTGAQLQGANLREANLWNVIADETTEMGLSDLRQADLVSEPRQMPFPGLHMTVSGSLTQALRLTAGLPIDPGVLPHVAANTGQMLVSDPLSSAWSLNSPQLTSSPADIDHALAVLLADDVAPSSSAAAENIAYRDEWEDAKRPLRKLLGCRLLANAASGRITLRTNTIAKLNESAGPCSKLP